MNQTTSLKNREFTVPLLLSILLHVAGLAFAMWIVLPSDFQVNREQFLNFNVKSVEINPLLKPGPAGTGQSLQKAGNPRATEILRSAAIHTVAPKDLAPKNKIPQVVARRAMSAAPGPRSEDETLLMSTQERSLKEKVGPVRRDVSESADAIRMAHAHRVSQDQLFAAVKGPINQMGYGYAGSVGMDPEEGMPGFTPVAGGSAGLGNADIGEGLKEGGGGGLLKYEALDEFLDIQVSTFRDPSDRQKYFMIKILAKKGVKNFKVMPKEIIFTIDCSLSINPVRLDQFKKGVKYCLLHLNPDDVFNVVSFKEKAEYLSKSPLKATPESIRMAEQYISGLNSNQRTDVYDVFRAIVRSPLQRIPSNIILLSDGRPTYGMMDSREVINSVARINKGARPVFALSGGSKVNRYLLDFIAYQNRGWSEYIKMTGDIEKGLSDFYNKIKDPIFLDLRYQLEGLDAAEVFPKTLPDFYRNAEFILYGKYDREDQFSMRLLGDVDGKTKELIFTRSLSEAAKGNGEIMRGYAFNKIYYLISRLTTRGQDPKILEEVRTLSKQYQIQTPYSPELEQNR